MYPLLIKSSYVFTAPKIAFESSSSGSSNARRCAASRHASLPTTGDAIPAFLPISSSLSTHMTSNFDALVDSISFCSFLFNDIDHIVTKLAFKTSQLFLI